MGSVGTPASRQAHFCFCEGILGVRTLSSARWPDDPHAGPMTCTWAPPPRRMSRGLRAYQRVNAHVQGFVCEQRAEIDTESAKVQTHCLKLTDFRLFSPNGSAVWRAHRFTSQPHRHQTGGIALHEAPTRRRHAAGRLRVTQTPTVADVEGAGGTARPGRGAGRKWRAGPRDGGSGGLTGATKFAQQHAFST